MDLKTGNGIENTDRVLSLIRHELGNPISALKVTLELLLRNYHQIDDSKKMEYLRRALQEVDFQHAYLDAIKKYAKADIDGLHTVPFLPFWEKYISFISLKMRNHDIEFEANDCGTSGSISTDPEALKTVFDCIIDNAIEAVIDNHQAKVRMVSEWSGPNLLVRILDNGNGIQADLLEKVFLPFFTTKPDASGVGLSIANKLVFRMAGEIAIANRTKGGLEVCVRLTRR